MTPESTPTSPGEFAAPDPAELSELLNGYEVTSLIACGGMGAVYLARQKSLDRKVAIKILPPEFGADPRFRAGFEAEAKAMARLNHPNLIAVFDFGEVDDFLFIIMEMVEGKSLHHSAHGKAIEQTRAARLVHGICLGLAHAHDANIIHRDIKPGNILLDPKKCPKIGDFGLARPAGTSGDDDLNFGTPDYIAPEVLGNPDLAGKQSDVYSVGVVLYELLTGRLPAENEPPPSQATNVNAAFDPIVRRAMNPSPALRYPDAGEMAGDLASLIKTLESPRSRLITGANKHRPAVQPKRPAATARPMVVPLRTPSPAASRVNLSTPTGRSGAAAPPGAARPLASTTRPNWILYRNLIFIAVLVFAVFGMARAYLWTKNQPPATTGKDGVDPGLLTDDSSEDDVTNPAPVGKYAVEKHRAEMRAGLDRTLVTHLAKRKQNYFDLRKKTASAESDSLKAWQSYFKLVDEQRWLLPRFLTEGEKDQIAIDAEMAKLLNEFAVNNQSRLDREQVTAIKALHAQSTKSLRAAGATLPPDSWEDWVDELKMAPLDLLADDLVGRWELFSGPADENPSSLTIERGGKVIIARDNREIGARCSRTSDGRLSISSADGSRIKLTWRDGRLIGEDRGAQTARFERKIAPFAVTRVANVPKPIEKPDPVKPKSGNPSAPPRAELAELREKFESELKGAQSFVDQYLARLEKQAAYAKTRGNGANLAQFEAELDRVKKIEWQKGRVLLGDIRSDNPVPDGFAAFKTQFEDGLYKGIGQRQSAFLERLEALQAKYEKTGKDTALLAEEIEFLHQRKVLDLTGHYNAGWEAVGDWYSDKPKPLGSIVDGYRSERGLRYDIRGIIQLNSGSYKGRNKEIGNRDLNKFTQQEYRLNNSFPLKEPGIPVYQKANTICLLGACVRGNAEAHSTVAQVVLRYQDLSEITLDLKYKVHLDHWWKGKDRTHGKIVWRKNDRTVSEVALPNPHPRKLIATIDLVSGEKPAAPFFLAITLD